MRVKILSDVSMMGANGFPISPGWWRQLGKEEKAAEVEAAAVVASATEVIKAAAKASKATLPPGPPPSLPPPEVDPAICELEAVLEQRQSSGRAGMWYRVRWAGYDPSFELWRKWGEVGSSLETWEPLSNIRHSEALLKWNQLASAASGSSAGSSHA